jgi:hypothetical protein
VTGWRPLLPEIVILAVLIVGPLNIWQLSVIELGIIISIVIEIRAWLLRRREARLVVENLNRP